MERLTTEAYYRAIQTRDARFDGRLFVGVTSTGIYCRPVCPARTPKVEHCRFFLSAAAAQTAGFRPCLRCRPETAPELASWRGTSNTVSRALALIAEGALDGDVSVEQLAARLGVGERQLRRLFQKHLGASPVAVAQTRRILFAKQLLHETQLPMAQVALAAGFGSLRRFNEIFHALFHRPPGALRRKALRSDPEAPARLLLRYRPPYDWELMLAFLRDRAIPGVECVEHGSYRRTTLVDGISGTVQVAHAPARSGIEVSLPIPRAPGVRALPAIVAQLRRVFDLNADVTTIGAHLALDPLLAPLVAQRPGLRAPGAWDGFELAVRAVLGQQITVEGARQLAGKLVALCGQTLPIESQSDIRLTHLFPSAECLASTDLSLLGMPAARRATLHALARAAVNDPQLFEARGTMEDSLARLRTIPGIGAWTAEYIALRALREPDAFPASDIGLLRGAGRLSGTRPTTAGLLDRAEPWRPWRAYAAQHLWAAEAPNA